MNNAAGNPSTEKGSFVTTWKKINGAWKVVEDAASPGYAADAVVAWRGDAGGSGEVDGRAAVPAEGVEARGAVGDPSKPEPFTIRLQMPNGYKIRRTPIRLTNM